MKKRLLKRGFTLIEIGIVLMVIGIIIGAIMKGKDIIKSAEAKDFAQTFARKWVMVTDIYYDKIGENIAIDSNSSNMGYMGEINLWGSAKGSTGTNPNSNAQTTIASAFSNAGINIADVIKTNLYNGAQTLFKDNVNPFEVSVAGEFTDIVRVGVGFRSFYIDADTASGQPIKRNLIIFRNVPGDMAQAFDKMIDGVANGTKGKVLAFQKNTIMDSTDTTASTYSGVDISNDDIIYSARTGDNTKNPIGYTDVDKGAMFTIGVILDH